MHYNVVKEHSILYTHKIMDRLVLEHGNVVTINVIYYALKSVSKTKKRCYTHIYYRNMNTESILQIIYCWNLNQLVFLILRWSSMLMYKGDDIQYISPPIVVATMFCAILMIYHRNVNNYETN